MLIKQLFRLSSLVFLITLSCFSLPAVSETLYVSDQLTVPMRSGASNQYRIVKFISSGTTLSVLGRSEDGKYIHVKTLKGKKGWVEKKHLMAQQSARKRLVEMKKKFSDIDKTVVDFETEIAALKQAKGLLEQQYKSLESEKQGIEQDYEDLKVTASSSIAISRKNKQLQRDLDQALASEAMLEKENKDLQNNIMQEWFLIGGGVSMGSLVLGILLTRINWRRKRDSWGDSF